jgi:hypothetical protein
MEACQSEDEEGAEDQPPPLRYVEVESGGDLGSDTLVPHFGRIADADAACPRPTRWGTTSNAQRLPSNPVWGLPAPVGGESRGVRVSHG